VYEMTPPQKKGGAWTEKVIYSFPTSKQGYVPWGDLVFDSAGNLYGATEYGGGSGTTCNPFYQYCGAVYELSTPKTKRGKWTEKVLYGFKGVAAGAQFGDGANPRAGVVLDSKGNVYGTTFYGGNNQKGKCAGGSEGTGCGEVFELEPPTTKGGAWTKKTIYRFNSQDGASPSAGVIFDSKGNLYGTAFAGLNQGNGGVFELKKPFGSVRAWTEKVLYAFSGGNDGQNPTAKLVFDSSGNLYGPAEYAQDAAGTVFRLRPPGRKAGGWKFTRLYGFGNNPDGGHPAARLIFDTTGTLYSTTTDGGAGTGCSFRGCGTVFQLEP
jgi:hypothetical protein